MKSVNRTAVVIRPKQPFVDWLNSIPNEKSDYTLDDITNENTTYLIPDFFGPKESMAYVKQMHSFMFEFELFGWYTGEELWPQKRTWKMFKEWFDIEINSEVVDLVNAKIEKEDL